METAAARPGGTKRVTFYLEAGELADLETITDYIGDGSRVGDLLLHLVTVYLYGDSEARGCINMPHGAMATFGLKSRRGPVSR